MTRTLISLAVVCLTVGQALAADRGVERASAHYHKGRAAFDQGKYDRAIAEFRAAYDLAPRPLVLYHLARAYQARGDDALALEHYRRFLDADPRNAKVGDDARAQVAALAQKLAPTREPEPEPPPASASEPTRPLPIPRPVAVVPPPPPPYLPTPAPEPDEKNRVLWIGGGVAAIGVGLAVDLIPSSGRNHQLDALDFVPLLLYAAGAAGIAYGTF